MTVALLAGGLGTRLRAAVADRPKVMAEVAGKPWLAWWLEALVCQGIREAILCTGYRSWQISDHFGDDYQGLRLRYSVEPHALGTGGALRRALPWVETGVVLALNADSFCELDLAAFWRSHSRAHSAASLAVVQRGDTARYGRVVLAPDGRVLQFQEKGPSLEAGWINAGVYLIHRRLLARVPPTRIWSLEHDLLPRWLSLGVHAYRATGRFIDIGTPEAYAEAQDFFAPSLPEATLNCVPA